MATGERVDPFRNFNFLVEIDGITQAGFSDCTGFGASNDPIEYREGGDNTTNRKLPGPTKYPNITKGIISRRNGSIILNDLEGNEVMRWNFFEAWPTKWDGPDFSAKGNDVAIQSMEIVCESIALG